MATGGGAAGTGEEGAGAGGEPPEPHPTHPGTSRASATSGRALERPIVPPRLSGTMVRRRGQKRVDEPDLHEARRAREHAAGAVGEVKLVEAGSWR